MFLELYTLMTITTAYFYYFIVNSSLTDKEENQKIGNIS